MDFLILIIWAIVVYTIIRNIPLRLWIIVLISILIGALQWFVMIFYENVIFDWVVTLPKWVRPFLSFIYLFMPMILAITIRKYFIYVKKKKMKQKTKNSI